MGRRRTINPATASSTTVNSPTGNSTAQDSVSGKPVPSKEAQFKKICSTKDSVEEPLSSSSNSEARTVGRKWSLTSTDTFYSAHEACDDIDQANADHNKPRKRARHSTSLLGPPKLRLQKPEPENPWSMPGDSDMSDSTLKATHNTREALSNPHSTFLQEADASVASFCADPAVHIDVSNLPDSDKLNGPTGHIMRPLSWLSKVRPSTIRHMRADIQSMYGTLDPEKFDGSLSSDYVDGKAVETSMSSTIEEQSLESDKNSGRKRERCWGQHHDRDEDERRPAIYAVIVTLTIMFAVTLGGLIYLLKLQSSFTSFAKPGDHIWGPGYIPHMTYKPRVIEWEPITASDPNIKALLSRSPLPDKLKLSGVTYTPSPGADQVQIYEDVATLSLLTNRLRLESTDNFTADYVLQAFKDLSLNMTLTLGIAVDSEEHVLKQLADLRDIIQKRPVIGTVDAIYVGEDSLFYGRIDQETLLGYINYIHDFLFRERVTGVAVGTADRSKYMGDSVLANTSPIGQNLTGSWIVELLDHDPLRVHTNINEHRNPDPQLLHKWVHDVAPALDQDILWFWPTTNATQLYNMAASLTDTETTITTSTNE